MRGSPAAPVPAIVLGADVTGLGVIRCLGRAGIPTHCASRELGFVESSRWCRPTEDRVAPGDDLGSFLRRLPFGRAVLFACSDDWVRAVAALDEGTLRRFPASQPPEAALDALLDKRALGKTLGRLRLPHPRTVSLRVPSDLDAVSDEELLGSFLKPCDSQACTARFRTKGFAISSRAEALTRMHELTESGLEFVLQEYVPGPPRSHFFVDGFVDRTGRTRARFARQRLRMHPPRWGNSSLMRSVPTEEVAPALRTLDTLLADLAYRGIFSAEFKHDVRDGAFKLLEVNVRPWWYVEFAAQCGVDVCRMAYRDALGLGVADVASYRSGVRCVNARTDLQASAALVRAGQIGWAGALSSWIGARQAIFEIDDPVPALVDLARRASRRMAARDRE